jgi:hypothetical protein
VHTLDRKELGVTYNIKRCAIDLEHALEDLVSRIEGARYAIKNGFYSRRNYDSSEPQPIDQSVEDSLSRPRVLRACREVSYRGKHFLAAASEV